MKIFILLALLCAIIFSFGCTKIVYTHQQVMATFRTRADIVDRFGLPTEKREGEGIIEWIYNFGTISVASNFGNSHTGATIYANNGSAYGSSNTMSANVTSFTQFNKYIKFTLDNSGNVTKWQSQGVDLTVRTAVKHPPLFPHH
jgi:hypothetical protein